MKRTLTAFTAALILTGSLVSAAMAQYPAPPITRGEVARFDEGYLDEHPEVARQLGHDPRLVDNPQFLATHPGLDAYLAHHPGIRTELQAHPDRFMTDEWRHEHRENGGYGEGITRGEVSRFDEGYLDEHPEVARELGRDPRLVDNPQFLATHPGLDTYLAHHPGIRTELQAHPDHFMTDEWRREHWEAGSGPHPLRNTDRYLSDHPEVEHQLNADPRLIDNRQYVDSHPGLHEFLETHPDARHQWKSHPYEYMHREDQYQKHHP